MQRNQLPAEQASRRNAPPAQRRSRPAREDGSATSETLRRMANHKILRLSAVALLCVGNCVFISSFAGGSPFQNLGVEALFGIVLIIFLALEDMYLYAPLVMKLTGLWQRLATRDSLTGLYNRLAFLQALEQRIAVADTTRSRYGVMFIDLNKFKQINDTYGHAIGDGVLTISARRIVQAVGSDDFVARLGGDEFAVLLMRTNVVLARKVEVELETLFKTPMTIKGHVLFVGASIGTCLAGDHHKHAEDVIHAADILMYRKKAQSRWNNNIRINDSKLQGIKKRPEKAPP